MAKPNPPIPNEGGAEADYDVGYRRPPRHSQFRPGVSGNPRGRQKGARNLAAVVASTLAERVTVTENGKRKRITKLDAAIKQLVNRAAAGDAKSTQLLLAVVQASEARPPQDDPATASPGDDLVMTELLRRVKGPSK